MSWASRRRTSYATGVTLFFVVVIGGPLAYWYFSVPPTCTDGSQNQGETGVDIGGPCLVLDTRTLSPSATLWTRSFRVRDGSYNAVAYVQNPNDSAGVARAQYRFGLYDESNVLIAERIGTTYLMPGSVTPVFEGAIPAGNRIVSRTYFEFTGPLKWERMDTTANALKISDTSITDTATAPRASATVQNTSVSTLRDLTFIIAVFDPAGNAFAASQTALEEIAPNEEKRIMFTWPDPFNITIGRIDIIPLSAPKYPSR